MTLVIRAMGANDIPQVAEIETLSTPHAWSPRALLDTLASETTRAYVATPHTDTLPTGIVGHIIATCCVASGELLLVAVHPRSRRQGIARALLDRVLADWDASGLDEGWLEVRADNIPAIRLYETMDFRHSGRRPRYYADGTDAVLMTRLRRLGE